MRGGTLYLHGIPVFFHLGIHKTHPPLDFIPKKEEKEIIKIGIASHLNNVLNGAKIMIIITHHNQNQKK